MIIGFNFFFNQFVLLNIFVKSWKKLYIYIVNIKKVKKCIQLNDQNDNSSYH